VLVTQTPTSNPNYNKFEAAAAYFSSKTSSWGMPFEVYRVYEPAPTGTSQVCPYTNSLILNKKVYVPVTGNSNDAAALAVYQQAMPGYEIISVQQSSSAPWYNTDALHCRVHEIADRQMLYIKHQPYFADMTNTGSVTFSAEVYSYGGHTIYPYSVLVWLSANGGAFQHYQMTNTGGNSWEKTVYGLPAGQVKYYIFAADNSGRRENHPYIGQPDPHKFTLTGAPPPAPVLALSKISSLIATYNPIIVDDFITVYNNGNADLIFTITNIDFDEILTISPLGGTVQASDSLKITLSYNFTNLSEHKDYIGSFKLISNDPQHPETNIALLADPAPYLSLNKTNSTVSTDEPAIIEDIIEVTNQGNVNLTFNIVNIDFDDILTVDPLEGTVAPGNTHYITLTYDFNSIAKIKEYAGSFKLLSDDPLRPETEITLHATLTVGIDENEASKTSASVWVYPNPTTGKLQFMIADQARNNLQIENVEIFDVFGRKVSHLTSHDSHLTIDLSHLPNGVYFYSISSKEQKINGKLMIMR
jgi:hypothetical protein